MIVKAVVYVEDETLAQELEVAMQRTSAEQLPFIPSNSEVFGFPDPTQSRFVTLAYVAGIDCTQKSLQLATPTAAEVQRLCHHQQPLEPLHIDGDMEIEDDVEHPSVGQASQPRLLLLQGYLDNPIWAHMSQSQVNRRQERKSRNVTSAETTSLNDELKLSAQMRQQLQDLGLNENEEPPIDYVGTRRPGNEGEVSVGGRWRETSGRRFARGR